MKAIKFMLSACVAAVALTSCEKEDIVPQAQNTRMKSVEISLENVKFSGTRGTAGDKIKAGDAVMVNDFKVFLIDDAGNEYTAKTEDGSADAQTYWSSADLSSGAVNAKFHYVDHACGKVVAVANLGEDMTYAEFLQMEDVEIDAEQDQKDLSLYAEAPLTKKGSDLEPHGTTVFELYEAKLMLKPRISRFEVDGFRVNFNATPKYQAIKILDIAFQNYYPTTLLATGEESGDLVNYMDVTNQTEVYNWFNDDTKPQGWYWDSFTSTSLADITPASPVADIKDAEGKNAPLAYHIFSGDVTPVMVIRLTADDQPAYIYSKGFKKSDGGSIDEFEEGIIYRMSAAGDALGDGSIPIDEEDIDPMDRCLDITVDVVDWAVKLIYPEF